jgi:formylglycine-generating enzyme required for sulfatase activity
MAVPTTSWGCAACGAPNAPDLVACAVCGAPRPVDALGEIRAARVLHGAAPSRATVVHDVATLRVHDEAPPEADARRTDSVTASPISADDTHLHGLRAAERADRRARAALSTHRMRAIPLLFLVASAALLLGRVAAVQVQQRTEAGAEDAHAVRGADPHRVLLPAVDAIIGLTEENKEAVLNLCWRVSGNPIHECQPSTLRADGEYPHRVVPVPALWMDAYEVSNAMWADCEADGACPPRDPDDCRFYTIYRYELGIRPPDGVFHPDRPAVCVTLAEARAFCTWRGMRLPSAIEWERAARAGEDRMQPWGSFWTPALINWGERDLVGFPIPGRLDGAELTAAVDAYPDGATREGLLNLFGNASEWVEPSAEEAADGIAPARGSNYTDEVMTARVTRHRTFPADQRRTTIGFRCVGDVEP